MKQHIYILPVKSTIRTNSNGPCVSIDGILKCLQIIRDQFGDISVTSGLNTDWSGDAIDSITVVQEYGTFVAYLDYHEFDNSLQQEYVEDLFNNPEIEIINLRDELTSIWRDRSKEVTI